MSSPRRGIFLDIDGCLISNDGNSCHEYHASLAKISELARMAHVGQFPRIFLCSGRDRNVVEFTAGMLGIVNEWAIVENGTAIFNPTIRQVIFNPAITDEARKIFAWIGRKIIPKTLKHFNSKTVMLQSYLGYMVCHCLEKVAGSQISIDAVYDFLHGRKEKGMKRKKGLLTRLAAKGVLTITRYEDRAVNLNPAGVSKGSAAQWLAERESIDLSYSLAIGDTRGDIPLFRKVGLVGCPSNAADVCAQYVRSKRGHVSLKPYSQGVVDIIEHFFPEGSY